MYLSLRHLSQTIFTSTIKRHCRITFNHNTILVISKYLPSLQYSNYVFHFITSMLNSSLYIFNYFHFSISTLHICLDYLQNTIILLYIFILSIYTSTSNFHFCYLYHFTIFNSNNQVKFNLTRISLPKFNYILPSPSNFNSISPSNFSSILFSPYFI